MREGSGGGGGDVFVLGEGGTCGGRVGGKGLTGGGGGGEEGEGVLGL